MPGPWVSDAVLYNRFAGLVGKDPATLPDTWPALVSEANKQAANTIAEILGGKGYTGAQLAEADNRVRWNTQLGLYYAFLETGAGSKYDSSFIDRFNIRQELIDAAVILVAGVPTGPTSPAATDVGGIGYGTSTAYRAELEADARNRNLFR